MDNEICLRSNGREIRLPALFIKLLQSRGVKQEGMVKFLFPHLADLPHPALMKNLPEAARQVVAALHRGRPIVVWGDYDVDGTTGTALLVNFFKELGVEVFWHIPNRLSEGYGLHAEWFFDRKNAALGRDFLLITVDCGISNFREVEIIKELGGRVIVTDHHAIPSQPLPHCLVVNPSQADCGFHAEQLAGVGLAFYLAAAVRSELAALPEPHPWQKNINLKKYLPFVALGTIADMVELTTTNRILVRSGIEALGETEFPGLVELLRCHQISGSDLNSEDIGFLLAPKLNAAGRLGKSRMAVALLTATEVSAANRLAQQLISINEERRVICQKNLEKALHLLSPPLVAEQGCAIVCGELHLGVAGIVASRLVEEFRVPAVVLAEKTLADGTVVFSGSARSVEGVNIVAALERCRFALERFGGHAMAAGLSVSASNFSSFSKAFSNIIRADLAARGTNNVARPESISCPVDLLMSEKFLDCLQLLEPFGPGNPQPVFCDNAAKIVVARAIGRESEHLHVEIRGKMSNLKGVGFYLGKRTAEIQQFPQRTLRYTPTLNRYRGTTSWQVRVVDI